MADLTSKLSLLMELTHYQKYGRAWYQKNRQRSLQRSSRWYQNNRKRAVEIVQAYVARNKEKVDAYNHAFELSLAGKYRNLKYRHNKRWTSPIIDEHHFQFLFSSNCTYCNSTTKGGIDRVDNTLGYTKENCTPCCELCNHMKWKLSKHDFLNHIERIANHICQ